MEFFKRISTKLSAKFNMKFGKEYDKKQLHKDILRLAWPSIAEQMLVMMVGMVSTIFVGRIGKETMAAVGMINSLMFFLQTIFAGLSTGTTVIVARVIGEGNAAKAKKALVQSVILCIIISAAVTSSGYVFAVPVIKLFFRGADPKVFEIALLFFRMIIISLPFMVLDMIIAGALRGSGDTKTPMYVTGVVNIINITLSSLLIFGVTVPGKVLIPALGVRGSAISIVTARVAGAIIRLIVLFMRQGKLQFHFKDDYSIDLGMMKRIANVGVPAFLEQLIMQGGFLIMQVIIVSMGTVQAAVYQIGVNTNSLAFMPIFGFSIAATAMVGQNLGRLDRDMAEICAWEANKIALRIISCIGVFMFIFARPLAMLYTTDMEVINSSIGVIRIFAAIVPFMAVMNVNAGVLRAAGDIMYVMVTAIVGLWSFRVAIAYSLYKFVGMGIYGVMTGICFDFCIRAVMYGLRVKAGKWKSLKV